DAEVGRDADQNFLERPHVPAQVPPVPGEIQDGIPQQLAGSVVRDVAAAVGLNHFGAERVQALRLNQQVRAIAVAPQRVNVRVLYHVQGVRCRYSDSSTG